MGAARETLLSDIRGVKLEDLPVGSDEILVSLRFMVLYTRAQFSYKLKFWPLAFLITFW